MKPLSLLFFLYDFRGRVSRPEYFLFLVVIVLGFVAAKLFDEGNCKRSPLIQNAGATDAAQVLPSGVMDSVRRMAIKGCERNWIVGIDRRGESSFRFQLHAGFKYSNGHLSGTPFQSLFVLFFTWPIFAVTAKRIHDLGLFARPFLASLVVGIGLVVASLVFGSMPFLMIAMALLAFIVLMSLLIILLTPGKTETNRFGPPPSETPA